jgi:hypothetical protein
MQGGMPQVYMNAGQPVDDDDDDDGDIRHR